MIKEAIEKIVELKKTDVLKIGEHSYSTGDLHLVPKPLYYEPTQAEIKIHTLTGIVDYLTENKDDLETETVTIFVENHKRVCVSSKVFGDKKQREDYIVADCREILESGFNFDLWYDIESFIIQTQANFVHTDNLKMLLDFISHIKLEDGKTHNDTGVSQEVTVKKGVSMLEETKVPNPVVLRPYRTFLEIEQPESSFVFRTKQEDGKVVCALFDASGGAWKLQAIRNIKEFFQHHCPEITVIA